MTRESAAVKGRRYAVEGRLLVQHVDAATVTAACRGSGEVWDVGYRRGGWFCTCPAHGRCSHLVALQLVTIAPPVARGGAS